MKTERAPKLLGFWMCLALVVGNIIGAGIFLLPASLAPYGPNTIWGWLLTIAGALCLAWVLAQLSRRIEGGPYAYVQQAFGDEAGFLVMWSYWISVWTAVAALAVAAVSYASSLLPALGGVIAAPLFAIACVWLFTLVNARGARTAGVVQVVTTTLKLLPLIAVCAVAAAQFGSGEAAALEADVRVTAGGIASVAALAMFAMLGFECATLPAGKVENAERVVPLATMAGTLLAGIATLGACAAVLFLLPGDIAATSSAPFADAIAPALGSSAGTLIALFALISALGALNGWILVSGEVPLSMAQARVFPAWFGKTTALGTPVRSQVVSSLIATALLAANYTRGLSGVFTFMILVSTVSALVLYGAAALAALKQRQAVVASIAGLAFTAFAFWGAGLEASLWGLGLLLTGVPIYWLNRRSNREAERAAAPQEPVA
ncbi:amino acid permease [Sphingomonas arenae]|uniref:amino acid permease n=1 Tax=Sphingomonas arenae TaxID=2812555 RepID=UPI001967B99E|nr:amino acid permease [Sphingomonas arenae]